MKLWASRLLDETSIAGPAAVALPGRGGGPDRILLAWRGNANSRNLTLGLLEGPGDVFVDSPFRTTVLSDTSDLAPSLLFYEDTIWLAWQGTNSGRTLNAAVVSFDDGSEAFPTHRAGIDWIPTVAQRQVIDKGTFGGGSISGPLLYGSTVANSLSVTATDENGEAGEATSSPAGTPWGPAHQLADVGRSQGPVAGVGSPGGRSFVNAWTNSDNRIGLTLGDQGQRTSLVSSETTPFNPSLAWIGGNTTIAWTGTNLNHNLNLGAIDVSGGRADPIWSKELLDEKSSAAPTLFVLRPKGSDSQLCIAWTDANQHLNIGTWLARG